ncbi:MAG: NAD(P)(+) transhydrogenase (Re/Si-specific) subunit beta [Planctomycetes bacterium]|nr:NAD(P)(+) transhydrogenase (Re/Si-specific) subunit beta [Planctomycetota bacterium]
MDPILVTTGWLAASVLFILSLRGLSSQLTARRGNVYGIAGMGVALLATLTSDAFADGGTTRWVLVIAALVVGSFVGAQMARRVAMTAMPELVALLHSFVGLAAILVGYASYLQTHGEGTARTIHLVEVYLAVIIGAITFTGSILAFLKLKGTVSGKPLLLPARHLLNLVAVALVVWLGSRFFAAEDTSGLWALLLGTLVAFGMGWHLVAAIGGADMPVVVSLLNSYSGWTASAAGFMLGNDLLIVTGALVGSSGAILSIIMCRAMNRSILNVVFGGFGTGESKKPAVAPSGDGAAQEVREASVDDVVAALRAAKSVVVVPGYGLAVARAQHAVREMTELLRAAGCEVRFAIHPVAGRLPGHMNVLLAEAAIPYDIVLEMDEIEDDLPDTDVVLVVGANDIVNPSAMTDPSSPIWGMPVIQVWEAKQVFMMKRSRAAGYAGVDNPLYYHPHTCMVFGDAKDTLDRMVAALRA